MGKSSLLNAWSRSDRAIVTNLPGTTRDVVESQLVVGGIPVQVLDTAGIRHSEDQVEKIGIERSQKAAQSADLVLFTLDATLGLTEADLEIYQQVKTGHFIVVINKIDQVNSQELEQLKITVIQRLKIENQAIVPMAAALNQGIPELEKAILNIVQGENIQAANLDFAINQRQAAALTRAKLCLEQVETTIGEQLPFDFWTIDLRGAIHALGEVTGEEVTESVLDRIFSRFCIGK